MQEHCSGGLYHGKQGGHWKVVLRLMSLANWDGRVQTLASALATGGKAATSDRQVEDFQTEDTAWTLQEFRIMHQLQNSIAVVAYDR